MSKFTRVIKMYIAIKLRMKYIIWSGMKRLANNISLKRNLI